MGGRALLRTVSPNVGQPAGTVIHNHSEDGWAEALRRQAPTLEVEAGQEWTEGRKKTGDVGRTGKRSQGDESGRGVAIKSRSVSPLNLEKQEGQLILGKTLRREFILFSKGVIPLSLICNCKIPQILKTKSFPSCIQDPLAVKHGHDSGLTTYYF